MKSVILIFPDAVRMAHFVLTNDVSNAEANTKELSLTAYLNEEQISIACSLYGAYLKYSFQVA